MPDPRSSHKFANANASVPEVLSLPPSCLGLSMDKLNCTSEQEACSSSSELQSVSSYNSLSSLSSCGSGGNNAEHDSVCSHRSSNSRPRSIFKTYWENSGSSPSISRANLKSTRSTMTPATASVSSWDSDEDSAVNSYERVLKRNEGVKTRRRSIFGSSQYQSTPSLRPYHPAPLKRRAKSASELEKRRLPSCLRSRDEPKIRCSSVSFDCEVSVITYSTLKENWAAEGWSKLFDSSIE